MKAKTRKHRRAHARAPVQRRRPPTRTRPVVAPKPRGRRAALVASPRRLDGFALAAAGLVGALLIGLSVASAHRGGTDAAAPGAVVPGAVATAALLDGIPQRGNTLGSANAPVQLVEYADLQCPYCAVAARSVLPTLIREYVRTGRVQLVFRGLAFLGPDSVTALRTASAAGSEGRMWNVLELLFRRQGVENAWITDDVLRSAVAAAGADEEAVFAARDGTAVSDAIAGWASLAETDGVEAVPAFFVGRRGGALEPRTLTSLSADEFRTAIDGELG